MVWITQLEARRALGDSLVLHISPRSVNKYVNAKWPLTGPLIAPFHRRVSLTGKRILQLFLRLEPFVVPTSMFPPTSKVELVQTYQNIRDLVRLEGNFRASNWYLSMHNDLERDGFVSRKNQKFTSIKELDNFFTNEMLGMINSLRDIGYDDSLSADLGTAMIQADGELVKSGSGDHRFAASRELGVCCVPLRVISVDRKWLQTIGGGVRSAARISRLKEALRGIEDTHRLCHCQRC